MTRKHRSGTGPSQRQLRVGEELRHHLAALLMRQETHIEGLDTIPITVSEVSVSPDLSNASVYVMTLGGDSLDIVLPTLNVAAPKLGHLIAGKVHLRRLPRLKFFADTSYDNADRISRAFASISKYDASYAEDVAEADSVDDDEHDQLSS
jgi:ribosome-binding factor A